MSEIKVVKQTVDFVWTNFYANNPDILSQTNVDAFYDCYSCKILRTDKGLFSVNVNPRLDIFTLGDVLFTASLSLNYDFLTTEHDIKEMLFYALQTGHMDFMNSFDLKADKHLRIYRPKFNEGKALELIDTCLYY